MKKEIAKKLERITMNLVSKTGSWVIFGEKKVPKELIEEYKNKGKVGK